MPVMLWLAIVSIGAGLSVQRAAAQSTWTKMKIQFLQQACKGGDENACQQLAKLNQKQSQQNPPAQTPGVQPGQTNRPGQQPSSRGGQEQTNHDRESGPILPPHGTKVEETVMAPLVDGAKFFVSPHGVHIATFETSGSRAVMYYDGVPGPKFDEIIGGNSNLPGEILVAFSPDGKRYAYCGRLGDEMVVMVDGKELLRTTESNMGKFVGNSCALGFTSNSQHVYMVNQVVKSLSTGGSRALFLFDGKPAPGNAGATGANADVVVRDVAFSPDGNHYAVVSADPADGSKWGLVIDGKMAPYRGGAAQWSADSQHLYTTLKTPAPGGRGFVTEAMLDGKPFLRADDVRLHVAPAGNMVVAEVFTASNTQSPLMFLVVDGKKVPGSEIVHQRGQQIDQVVISPNGKHYAARFTTSQGHQYVFIDGKRGQEYQTVDHIVFTADSSKVTYTAFSNAKPYVVIGDQESDTCQQQLASPALDTHGAVTTAPAGGRAGTLCIGYGGGRPTLYLDGKTLPLPDGVENGNDLRFSPDGEHYAYVATFRGNARRLVWDGVAQAESNLGSPSTTIGQQYAFSPDSRHVAVYGIPPTATGEYATGIFLDGKYVPGAPTPYFYKLEFTADSKHLAWAQVVQGRQGFRIFFDGKAVAEGDAALPATSPEHWWEMAPDGTLLVLAQDDKNLKRITITPSSETSLATMGGGRPEVANRVH